MAKGMYFSIDDVARKIKKMYIGVEGIARKVKKVYFGDENGIARLCWTGTVPAGQIIFTSSQIWTVPEGVKKIDIFCVGGGGGGGYYNSPHGGGGGGGGYTTTIKDVTVAPGSQYSIVVGAGASVSGGQMLYGGTSSFGDICIATGGVAPGNKNGGAGGSGGGGAGASSDNYVYAAGNGGSDGSNGFRPDIESGYGGVGSGITTRAFGEAENTLYAGGGGGGGAKDKYNIPGGAGGAGGGGRGADDSDRGEDGTPNTGGGGGGCKKGSKNGGKGGSGIVIVRWDAQ